MQSEMILEESSNHLEYSFNPMSLPVKLAEEIILTKDDFDESLRMLMEIKHAICRSAARDNYWLPCWNEEKNVAVIRPNNIFWLYFWAETGQGSQTAAQQSKVVFYNIFGSEKPYRNSEPGYETFFKFFDSALEATGLKFRVYHGKDRKNNPVRDALRPYACTNHCLEIFRQVMINMRTGNPSILIK